MTIHRPLLSFFALSALCLLPDKVLLAEQNVTQAPSLVTSIEGLTEYRLANGLQVLLFPDPGKTTATVNVTYKVGSRNENYGETGMAHLLEHLIFKGTDKHPDIPAELTAHGARPNGSTYYDRTNYFESFQASEENLRWAFDLEADRMVNSHIAAKDLWNEETKTGEMTVVRNEMESGENNPSGILMQRVLATAFEWHNYGKDVIGARADVENVDISRLKAFYSNWYQPDNAVLLVSGSFDPEKALLWINETFGRIPKPARVLPKTYTLDPVQDGERQVIVRRVGDVQWAMSAYKTPAGSDPDFAAIKVLAQILGDTPTGRLHTALVQTHKATAIFGYPMQLREPGLILFGLTSAKELPLDEAKDLLLATVEKSGSTPFSTQELERAKTQLLKQVELTLNDTERVGLELSESIAQGDWRLFFLDRDRIEKVTTEDLSRVAARYFKRDNRTLGLFIPTEKPDRSEIPALKDTASMLAEYKGRASIAQGEAFDTTPDAIEKRIQRSTTPEGLRLAILPKKTRGAKVNARLSLHFGGEKSLAGSELAGTHVAWMLQRGTTKHSRAELADLIDSTKSQLKITGDYEGVTISVETSREQLPKIVALLGEMLRQPAFSREEFEMLRREQLDSLEQERSEPTAIAVRNFNLAIDNYPLGHPRHKQTLEEEIAAEKALKLEELSAFHQRFYGASSGELSVVGDCDAAETADLFTQAFAGWKNQTAYVRMPKLLSDTAALDRNFETPDKQNAFVVGGQKLALCEKDADYPAMVLADFMLGGGFLNSRLATRIRQKDGLSYGVGSELHVSSFEKSSVWVFYAIMAPQNADKVVTAFREELERVRKDGFTAEEIKAAKSGWLQEEQVSRGQDNELASLLGSNEFIGRTLAFQKDLEARIAALTPAEIQKAVLARLDPSKAIIMRAGDFKAAATKAK